jgi:AraC-like DNA-binding protein
MFSMSVPARYSGVCKDDGYSFQRVLEEARRQLAHHYLAHSYHDLNDAAFLLGYNDAGSFVRAFRAWEGVPPARWREERRASVVSHRSM